MRSFAVLCACGKPATWKVAGVWSDGLTTELKTYALCCETCLPQAWRTACLKQAVCRVDVGETIVGPHAYRRTSGGLVRDVVVEQALSQQLQ